jgi:hypothetical protein
MLYPIQQKDLYLYPWFNLFRRFRQDVQKSKTWLVIGYNFNDEFIRNIFLEALESRDQTHELILVTPSAEKVLKEKFSKYQHNVKIIPKKFGDQQTTSEIIRLFGGKQTLTREIINNV